MAIAERTSETTWQGTLAGGTGIIRPASGALGELPVTWASRTAEPGGRPVRRNWPPRRILPASRWRWRCVSANTGPPRSG